MSNHQFFSRLAKAFIEEVTRTTPEGSLYRIDVRLRPEGDAGPLVRSLASYENYYAQWGQTWERMMLIKARCVAGDESLAADFLEMIQSFRYPRSLGEGIMREIATTKERIENEVVKEGELKRNVKLGLGGIREIEFTVQALQIINAGRQPFLQDPQTLSALDKLAKYDLLPRDEARSLADAYCFLRDAEHRLQMEENLQTHTIPTNVKSLERLASLMGFASAREFEAARQTHTDNVRRIYDGLLRAETTEARPAFPTTFDDAETEWKNLLGEHGFKDVEKSFRLLREFVEGPDYVHVSAHTHELARTLVAKFLTLCPTAPALAQIASREAQVLSDPDRVVTRLDSFIAAYGARSTLFEMWNSNPLLFELLLLLFDRSEFLAETAIRAPDLLDDLVLSDRLRRSKSAGEILSELRLGRTDADQRLWLRRYHQAEFMRIGLRDILELTDTEQIFSELSALAEACLQYALEVVLRENKIKTPPLVISGLGKLGGEELTYGSDLDVIFVADNNVKSLPKLQPIAVEVMAMLSTPTELGAAFHTDARLRPDGEKGLLVNILAAYEEYYRRRAQLWEIQTLTRTRPIAGDLKLGEKFQQLASRLANFKQPSQPLAAFVPDWKQQIHKMRLRIEKERTPAGQDALAIKTGMGGLMDAEFIAQALCLENGWQEANTLQALERARKTKVLPPADADKLIENYRQLRRLERILRRWSFEGETVLPNEDAPYYRVSVRCGFPTPEAFRQALVRWRHAIREVYGKVFQP